MALAAAEAAYSAAIKQAFADAIGTDDGGQALADGLAAATRTFMEAGDVVGVEPGAATIPVT